MDISLDEYNWKKVFNYGVMTDHAKKVVSKEGSLGERIVHALITSIHLIPLIGQISALAESLIATKQHDKAGQLGRIAQDPAKAAYQRGALILYGSMWTKPGDKQAAMAQFQEAAKLGNSNAMVQLALSDREHNFLYMRQAADQGNGIALCFQARELAILSREYYGSQKAFKRNNADGYVSFDDLDLDAYPLGIPEVRIFNDERANATAQRILGAVAQKDQEIEYKLKAFPRTEDGIPIASDFHTKMLIAKNMNRWFFFIQDAEVIIPG